MPQSSRQKKGRKGKTTTAQDKHLPWTTEELVNGYNLHVPEMLRLEMKSDELLICSNKHRNPPYICSNLTGTIHNPRSNRAMLENTMGSEDSYKNGDSVWMGRDDSPTLYHHGNAVTALSIWDNHEYEMAATVENMYDLAYEKAKTILLSNQNVVEKTVEELLEFEILTGNVI
ncbi:hypothetical protein LXL04_003082 [Taraxacum kok-saghyz]